MGVLILYHFIKESYTTAGVSVKAEIQDKLHGRSVCLYFHSYQVEEKLRKQNSCRDIATEQMTMGDFSLPISA